MPQWIEMTRSPEYSPKLIGQELTLLQSYISGTTDMADLDAALKGQTIIMGGYLNTQLIAANSIVGDKISSNAIDARHIQAGAITSDKIAAQSITADKLDVQTLSAITANLGEVTSGTITGATIRTSSSGDRVQLDGTNLKAYYNGIRRVQLDYDSLDFYSYANRLAGSITAGEFEYSVFGSSGSKNISVPGLQLDVGTGGLIILESRNGQRRSGIELVPGGSDYYGHLKMQVYDSSSRFSLFEINGMGAFINGVDIMHRGLIQCGQVNITPTANSPSSVRVYFTTQFTKSPAMVASAWSGAPETSVKEVTVNNVSRDYGDIVIYRTNSTTTTLFWIAMEPE